MNNLDIVIPLFNQSSFTKQCLQSLLSNTANTAHLICVDNASTDDTWEVLEEFKKKFEEQLWTVTLLHNKKNVGFGRAMNQGARQGNGQYLALLNNDTWLSKSWDKGLITAIEQLNADMVSPYYYEGELNLASIQERATKFITQNKNKTRHHWGGPFMFFRRSSFEQIGMFDERFFVSFEDTDLRHRFEQAGLRYFQVGDSFIWHHSKGTRAGMTHLEEEGLKLFMDKWGFDPRPSDNTYLKKLRKKIWKIKEKYGYF